ncbi:hypothetical protein BJY21_002224 [Kineosphaera limosa]|uniref:Protein kinase domain-containing protein n=1 Tax=Kineosphaera limosa NBRC 100340 TaxID=1184609 RepID=K6W8A4_9MICO|nr:protein kinase family protein [Kineosphaera limosa]NYE01040.1 hypothetical protein [Kineosphaera limosa]GAB95425.1 hypothetical protein KILIM_019_00790 [Kineosphaera limosa NBRC 100340]
MYGVGTGRVIADRYALSERRAHLGSIEVWSAVDSTLGREVSITLFPSNLSRADAIVDAARRSAALNDPRLVRVLDVGTGEDVSWLVEESLSDSSSIADLISTGPLPPEEARRIAGEVASGLAAAASRGLHHLHVTPHSVRRTDGGLIKIAGLATASALEGDDDAEDDRAERIDTVATVALMYAAMTTRWPLPQRIPGLEAAPRIVGGVAAPSEIAVAVPPDLDAICRATLNHDTGPRSPRELVDRIAPWSHTQVKHMAPKVTPVSRPPAPAAPTEAIPAVRPGGNGGRGRRSDRRAGSGAAAGAGAGAAVGATVGAGSSGSGAEGGATAVAASAGPIARVREHREAERAARAASTRRRLEERRADPSFLNLPEALDEQRNTPLPPPAPMLPRTPEVEGRHAKLILAVVVAVIIAAMMFAVPTMLGMFSRGGEQPEPQASPGPGTAAPTTPGQSPAASPTLGDPITPVGITSFDPQGDGTENESAAPRAIDGDQGTFWRSEGYRSNASFGNQKDGVGLVVELPAGTTVHEIRVWLPDHDSQDVEFFVNDSASLDGATRVGGFTDGKGERSVPVRNPTAGSRLIVWVTKAAAESDGRFRAQINEIVLR